MYLQEFKRIYNLFVITIVYSQKFYANSIISGNNNNLIFMSYRLIFHDQSYEYIPTLQMNNFIDAIR